MCPYRMWIGSYLLGALAPGERHEFDKHLPTCHDCRTELISLAALPGLLTRVRKL
ncbi:zf-HC2 domain-containing protein [Micromonospora sp. NBC_00898]|uniref:anti-sigma factor family protein n=1 Tax=Micromonospora sp. NBC_00898 TaxID=2975981 RepID=UPI003864F2A6|nr:zf-HC2 domain-containing protein [Micromonospora sp. NBC_00898]